MTETSVIMTVTGDDFDKSVIEASRDTPVLVDFWAEWCQPCHMLVPVLEQLASESAGRIRIAKVNTDENPGLAARFGIRSLPTVKLLRHGEAVAEFSGVRPLAVLQEFVRPHLPRESDALTAEASTLAGSGRRDEAIEILEQALESDPENYRIHPELVRLQIEAGKYDEAEAVINMLPANTQQRDDTGRLYARLGFARIAGHAPDTDALVQRISTVPDDLDARYQLAAVQVLEGDYGQAMENLLEIIRRDRRYRDDAARRALLDVFNLLGNECGLVKKYRRLLASAIN